LAEKTGHGEEDAEGAKVFADEARHLRELGNIYAEAARIREGLNCHHAALIAHAGKTPAIEPIADLSIQNFDYESAYWLSQLVMEGTGKAEGWCLRVSALTDLYIAPDQTLSNSLLYTVKRPATIGSMAGRLSELKLLDNGVFSVDSFLRTLNLGHEYRIPYVQALMELGRFNEALEYALKIVQADQTYQAAVVLSKAYCFLDRYKEADSLISEVLEHHKVQLVFDEALKVCIYTGNYLKADRLMAEAESLNIHLGDVLPRKIHFGRRRVKKAFETFRTYEVAELMRRVYRDRYLDVIEMPTGNQILVVPMFGPGDEIRFSASYDSLEKLLKFDKITLGCEPRLLPLFQRSFAGTRIGFFPITRVLRQPKPDLSKYNKLPTSKLMVVMDNSAHALVEGGASVVLVTDLLATAFPSYQSFSGKPFLIADEVAVNKFKERLPKDKLLVGINWRSSVTHQTRQEHYLSVEDIEPLLLLENIQFVNLQYDDCAEELDYLQARSPNQIINFADLDQYNDLDGVAALMSAIDLIIAPCTTVAELSGALGRPTWLLANSSETQWRIVNGENKDVWYNCMEHVEGQNYRNKTSLVEVLASKLVAWRDDKLKHSQEEKKEVSFPTPKAT
jgi:capsular polysaccharide export protein